MITIRPSRFARPPPPLAALIPQSKDALGAQVIVVRHHVPYAGTPCLAPRTLNRQSGKNIAALRLPQALLLEGTKF